MSPVDAMHVSPRSAELLRGLKWTFFAICCAAVYIFACCASLLTWSKLPDGSLESRPVQILVDGMPGFSSSTGLSQRFSWLS